MEDAVLAGKARAIGFSNVDERTLAAALAGYSRVKPAFVSNVFNPFHQDRGVRALCEREGVLYQGFNLLGRSDELSHPVYRRIAASHGASPAQVVVRWALTKNVTVLTSSRQRERMRSNRQLDFDLSKEELESIDALQGTPWPLPAARRDSAAMVQVGPHAPAGAV
uniref:NADP-dependent oxidoreductase domain-containing protein n=1 Tax=Alexandrium catenella TaxID=2925 RepID=A0A7S1R3G3_ALECA